MWRMVLCRSLPLFGPYVETYAHLSSIHVVFNEVIPHLDEFVANVGDLAFGLVIHGLNITHCTLTQDGLIPCFMELSLDTLMKGCYILDFELEWFSMPYC
jgi:hypothetical protein